LSGRFAKTPKEREPASGYERTLSLLE